MKEKSCGAIVYKKENDEFKFLLVLQNNGHYNFPKGHVEQGETEIETALREIKEETNLDVNIDSNFRHQITYIVEERNIMKDTVYFVANPINNNLKNQEVEILNCDWYTFDEVLEKLDFDWYTFDEVLEKLDFDNIKEAFNKAYDYIKNNI